MKFIHKHYSKPAFKSEKNWPFYSNLKWHIYSLATRTNAYKTWSILSLVKVLDSGGSSILFFIRRATDFHRRAKLFELDFSMKHFLPDALTSWAKSSSQLVSLPGSQPSMKPLILQLRNLCREGLKWLVPFT